MGVCCPNGVGQSPVAAPPGLTCALPPSRQLCSLSLVFSCFCFVLTDICKALLGARRGLPVCSASRSSPHLSPDGVSLLILFFPSRR